MLLFRLLALGLVFLLATGLNACVGDMTVSPSTAWQAIFHNVPSDQASFADIFWQIRLPRLLIAMVVGAALSISGYVLQNISRNPLADPYLTGVSSGSGLAVAIALTLNLDFRLIPLLAFAGGLVASLVVARLAKAPIGISVTRLLLAGVGLSAICGGIITLLLTTSPNLAQSQGIFFWLAGGIAGKTWAELTPVFIGTVFGAVVALIMSKQMRLLSLGQESAQALGVNVAKTQWCLLGAAVLLCASAVSISGLVGFVGLIGPHITRKLFGRDERLHIICAGFVGAVMVMVSDLAARTLAQGQELPLGTLLSVAGGPFFLWLVYSHKDMGY
jgi:iron complex transport system permease protein